LYSSGLFLFTSDVVVCSKMWKWYLFLLPPQMVHVPRVMVPGPSERGNAVCRVVNLKLEGLGLPWEKGRGGGSRRSEEGVWALGDGQRCTETPSAPFPLSRAAWSRLPKANVGCVCCGSSSSRGSGWKGWGQRPGKSRSQENDALGWLSSGVWRV